ncbi:hypothetical protein [Streptomyces sp. TRM49041]|uniref:hypothetical protein n=1 Tax=Streptomyces sp. TRM49041 TaxID=2603216 RepID=UPI0011EF681A|nr:hypothetical protein [Streptomyces sp. TRM49041]
MPRTDARPSRVAVAALVLVGALLGLVLCAGQGASAVAAADEGPPNAARDVTSVTSVTSATRATGATAVIDGGGTVGDDGGDGGDGAPAYGQGGPPGCGNGSPSDDGGLAPAAPPRGSTPGELLPALYDGRGAVGGAWCGAWAVTVISPERAPPELVPPSPMDLSILRV